MRVRNYISRICVSFNIIYSVFTSFKLVSNLQISSCHIITEKYMLVENWNQLLMMAYLLYSFTRTQEILYYLDQIFSYECLVNRTNIVWLSWLSHSFVIVMIKGTLAFKRAHVCKSSPFPLMWFWSKYGSLESYALIASETTKI